MLEVWYDSVASRACAPSICTQKAQNPICEFGRILAFLAKKYFASNVPYVCKYVAIALGYESPTPGESLIDISSLQKTRKF